MAFGLIGLATPVLAEPLPIGGDGSSGFVLTGIDVDDGSGYSVRDAGDINGEGIDVLIIGACRAKPNGLNDAGESYVVFGHTTGFPALFELSSLLPLRGTPFSTIPDDLNLKFRSSNNVELRRAAWGMTVQDRLRHGCRGRA